MASQMPTQQKSAMSKPFNWAFIPIAIIVIILGFMTMGYYNTIQTLDEDQSAAAAEVINQYKRRSDLITNLANTVQGYSDHEKSIFTDIAASRAKLNELQINPNDFQDPQKLEAYELAQTSMKQQLSRLLVLVESYPDLKASELYKGLMVQLEGTENRISVARKRYINAVKEYNTTLRRVPYLFVAKVFGYAPLPQFDIDDPMIDQPPVVNFN